MYYIKTRKSGVYKMLNNEEMLQVREQLTAQLGNSNFAINGNGVEVDNYLHEELEKTSNSDNYLQASKKLMVENLDEFIKNKESFKDVPEDENGVKQVLFNGVLIKKLPTTLFSTYKKLKEVSKKGYSFVLPFLTKRNDNGLFVITENIKTLTDDETLISKYISETKGLHIKFMPHHVMALEMEIHSQSNLDYMVSKKWVKVEDKLFLKELI